MTITKCVIPAAGLGTRLLPITKSQPKEMVAVGPKPVIQYVVEEAIAAGLKEILIITGSRKRSIEDHFDYDSLLEQELERRNIHSSCAQTNLFARSDIQILFTRQSRPTGLADAVALAKTFVDGEPFAVSLGDNIVVSQDGSHFLSRLLETHEKKNGKATLTLKRVSEDEVEKYGIAESTTEGFPARIRDVIEKPSIKEAPSRLAIVGRYVFEPEIFEAIGNTEVGLGGERQLTDAIRYLIQNDKEVWGMLLGPDDILHDIGTPYSYALAFVDMCLRDPKIGPNLRRDIIKLVER